MALHVYGVTWRDGPSPEGTGRQDMPLRRVEDDVLAVVVSDVDENRRAGAADLMAHAGALEKLVAKTTVVPMQFGIMLPDENAVREQVLDADGEWLVQLLNAFDGLVQMSVQIFEEEEPALREVLRRDPDLIALREAAQGPEATTQQQRIELGQAVTAGLEQLAAEDAAGVLERITPHAVAVVENEPRAVHEVAHVALLVEREKQSALDAAVGDLRAETQGRLMIRYVGPQPPYSFIEHVASGEIAWA
jgi:hypothetical protein